MEKIVQHISNNYKETNEKFIKKLKENNKLSDETNNLINTCFTNIKPVLAKTTLNTMYSIVINNKPSVIEKCIVITLLSRVIKNKITQVNKFKQYIIDTILDYLKYYPIQLDITTNVNFNKKSLDIFYNNIIKYIDYVISDIKFYNRLGKKYDFKPNDVLEVININIDFEDISIMWYRNHKCIPGNILLFRQVLYKSNNNTLKILFNKMYIPFLNDKNYDKYIFKLNDKIVKCTVELIPDLLLLTFEDTTFTEEMLTLEINGNKYRKFNFQICTL